MNDCPDRAELALFTSGRLHDDAASKISAHLDTCANCRGTVEDISSSDPLDPSIRRKDDTPFNQERTLKGVEHPQLNIAGAAQARPAATLKAIPGYEILEKLGEGGMGAVYKARHTRLKKIVAIKVLRSDRLEDENAVARFEREMEAVGKLEHPNLVRAMDAGEQDGTHYLVMEYVPGSDLSNLVREHDPLPIADACELVRQAALGLQSAHEHGLVHRDIKPSNLILSTSGTLKILDLGLALLGREAGGAETVRDGRELTDPGQMMGTLDYMSPEQGAGSDKVDIRADIYSLGATLYKLLTGQAPFGGEKHASPMQKLAALATETPAPVQSLRADVPLELAAVVTKMLARDPRSRFTTPAELAQAIRPFARGNHLSQLLLDPSSRTPETTSPKSPTEKLSNSMSGTQGKTHVHGVQEPELPNSVAVSQATAKAATRPLLARLKVTAYHRPTYIAVAAGLLLLTVGGLYYGITILIRNKEGKVVGKVELPDGTKAEIQQDGKKVAEVDNGKLVVAEKPVTPEPKATGDAPAAKPGVEEMVDRVDDGVVLITALDVEGGEVGLGSGFVVGPGLIATNYHVIKEASEARVQLHDGTSCEVLGCRAIDPDADLAILELKAPPENMTTLTLRKADEPRPGSSVVAIGHPSGFRFSITTGIVSAVHRTDDLPNPYREFLNAPPDHLWIQTSAPISPGNSGGPLLDDQGQVIGINTWVAGGTNLGFALHIRHVAALLARLKPEVLSLKQLAEPQQKLKSIVEDYQKQQVRSFKRPTEEGSPRSAQSRLANHSQVAFAEQLLVLAEKNPDAPAALDALSLIFMFDEMSFFGEPKENVQMPEAVYQRAGGLIVAKYIGNPRLLKLVLALGGSSSPRAWDLLRQIATTGPKSDLQGVAAFSLARAMQTSRAPDARFNKEIESLLTGVTTQHGELKIAGKTLASHAAPLLVELKESLVGRPAPPTTGKDPTGKQINLGDFRGKVVVLVFWSDAELQENSSLYADLRTLAAVRGSLGLVVVGVNADNAETARGLSDKAMWPTFHDGPDGPIAKQWHIEEFPVCYVIDHQGNVRYRSSNRLFVSSASEELLTHIPSAQLTEAINVSPTDKLDDVVPGVTAERIVVWNQHNAERKDRGTTSLNLRLFRHGLEVWKQEGTTLPWAADQDTSVSIPVPSVRFDRVRVEVEAWQGEGGGLSEIEVFQGEHNLARGCPADASDYFGRNGIFTPARVTDGLTSSASDNIGYWLLPSASKGWVDVDVSAPTPPDSKGTIADRVVIWNQFNPPHNDRGTKTCTLRLLRLGKEVWSKAEIAIPWEANQDLNASVDLPKVEFDSVRVEVDAWHGSGGGLSEVQVFRGEENIAEACPTIESRFIDPRFGPERLVDGVVRSRYPGIGFWLLPDSTTGWVEIDVSGSGTAIGAVRRKLGAQRCFLDGDWQRGARWMLRSDQLFLRRMARREQFTDLKPFDDLDLAGGWWGLAQQSSGAAKQGLLTMALKHYWEASRGYFGDEIQPLLRERIHQAMAVLPQQDYLFFMPELSVAGVDNPEDLRAFYIKVGGRVSPFGLSAKPPANGSSRIEYRLDRPYKQFQGSVGLNDLAGESKTAIVFRILGDGKELWKSQPVEVLRDGENFDLDVTGVRNLTLLVDCPGDNLHAMAEWVDPRLSK